MRAGLVALTLVVSLPARAAEMVEVGVFPWLLDQSAGLSGFDVSEDGLTFVAVSDRGWHFRGHFERDDAGRITAVRLDALDSIVGTDGLPVAARASKEYSDAEGLAVAPDGTEWISFERWPQVRRYEGGVGPGEATGDNRTFYDLAPNRGLEALALDPEGGLVALPELPFAEGFPVYRHEGDGWVIGGYLPQRDGFAIVGADFAPDGDLYILERKLDWLFWWQSRVRRVRLDGSLDETVWTSEPGQYGDLEGIAVWAEGEGLRVTMVSDNNQSRLEATEFVEYRLTETPAPPAPPVRPAARD